MWDRCRPTFNMETARLTLAERAARDNGFREQRRDLLTGRRFVTWRAHRRDEREAERDWEAELEYRRWWGEHIDGDLTTHPTSRSRNQRTP